MNDILLFNSSCSVFLCIFIYKCIRWCIGMFLELGFGTSGIRHRKAAADIFSSWHVLIACHRGAVWGHVSGGTLTGPPTLTLWSQTGWRISYRWVKAAAALHYKKQTAIQIMEIPPKTAAPADQERELHQHWINKHKLQHPGRLSPMYLKLQMCFQGFEVSI